MLMMAQDGSEEVCCAVQVGRSCLGARAAESLARGVSRCGGEDDGEEGFGARDGEVGVAPGSSSVGQPNRSRHIVFFHPVPPIERRNTSLHAPHTSPPAWSLLIALALPSFRS